MNYQSLAKKGPMYAFLATVVLLVVTMIPIISGKEAFDSVPVAQQSYSTEGDMFYAGLYITGALLIISVAAAVLLSLLQVVTNPKGAMKGLISVGILFVLFIVFYAMADGTATGTLGETIERFSISEPISKVIGAGIRLTILLGLGSVILLVLMEIWNYFKNQ